MSDGRTQVELDEIMGEDQMEPENSHIHIRQLGIEIPNRWKEIELGEIGSLDTSSVNKKSNPDENTVNLVNYLDVYNNYEIDNSIEYMQVTAPQSQIDRSQVQIGDILFTPSSEEPGDIGHSAVVTEQMENTLHSYHTVRLRPTGENISLDVLFSGWVANAPYVSKQFARRATGSTRYTLTLGDFSDTRILVPPVSEQHKIATVLYTVDRAIEKYESILNRYERLQTGLLRTHFGKESVQTNHTDNRVNKRLGPKTYSVPEEWEVVQIANIGEVVTGDTPPTKNDEYFGGDLPFVTPGDFGDTKYQYQGSRGLTDEGRKKARPIPEESVMMDCIGMDMGKVRIAGQELATNQQINSVVVDSEQIMPEFLYFHLKAISNLIQSQAGQTRTPIVNKNQFKSFEIFLPPIHTQKEIVDSLSAFDNLIENSSKQVSQLYRLKSGLMQDLLSGTVRTTDTNIEVPDEIAQHG